MEATEQNIDAFRHAHWRVKFLRQVIELHKTSPRKGAEDWYLSHGEYLGQMHAAERELHRFPAHWETTYGLNNPGTVS
jgi:hypothetical protein